MYPYKFAHCWFWSILLFRAGNPSLRVPEEVLFRQPASYAVGWQVRKQKEHASQENDCDLKIVCLSKSIDRNEILG